MLPAETGLFPGRPGLKPCTAGGAPCRDSENAFILACISDVRPLALVAGIGRRAALTGPSGAEDALMVGAEESLGFRNEGGLGDSSGEPEDWGCTSSVPFVVFGDEVFAFGSTMMYGGRGGCDRGARYMFYARIERKTARAQMWESSMFGGAGCGESQFELSMVRPSHEGRSLSKMQNC
jgi:hypothetical protein